MITKKSQSIGERVISTPDGDWLDTRQLDGDLENPMGSGPSEE